MQAFSAVGRLALPVTQFKVSRGSEERNRTLSDNRRDRWPCHIFLALKARAFYQGDRTSEALEAIREAEALVERSEALVWCAELHRLRGVFLAARRCRGDPD